MSLFTELKRRNIFKVAMAYLALGWVVVQVTDMAVPALNLPESLNSIVFYLGVIGFPFAMLFTWAFELTPDGIKKTAEVEEVESISATTGQKMNYAIIGLLIIAVGFLLYDRGAEQEPEEIILADIANTIAVLPFEDLSADGTQDYFGKGMAEEILNVLVSVDELDVASRTSAFALKDQNLLIPEIAERLNVNYIVEGSIRSDGDNVRITAQLIDVAADRHLWSDTYDRELTSIFAIQDEISVAIADALKVELIGDALGDVPTQNMEAYGLFLQARRLLDDATFDDVVKVGELANQMIKLDPNYADAWSLMASFYMQIAGKTIDTINDEVKEKCALAMEDAEKAIRLDANNGYGWGVKGAIHLRLLEWKEAENALKQSVLVGSKDSANWQRLGQYHEAVGAISDALRAYKISLEINPNEVGSYISMLRVLINQGNIKQIRIELENSRFKELIFLANIRFQLSIMELEQDKSIEQFNIWHQNNGLPSENIEQFINAYYDPPSREETKKLLPPRRR
ncbi:MAG: hypothetical protein HOH18_04150 [Kordiimonadaceae bacterium]|nr:hypothetical protein [Kordiimonadaceae bacterium]MBT7581373.1 hypothetical protein [Kordiimonadaceae bacterium]